MISEFIKQQAKLESTRFNSRYENQSTTLTNYINKDYEVIE